MRQQISDKISDGTWYILKVRGIKVIEKKFL